MTEEDALLQAISAEPEDDAPRLVYADWLEERGDPRGEFIRLECALARADPNGPRAAPLWTRRQQLINKYEREWIRELRPFLKSWAFRRGLVEQAGMGVRRFLDNADTLFRKAPVRHLRLFGASKLIGAVARCPHLARLTSLDLYHNNIGDEGAEALAASPHLAGLRELFLSFNRIGDRGALSLAASPHLGQLTRLEVVCNDIGPAAAAALRDRFGDRLGP
jgi:uncharacterized protein (TIGR02996 family)